MKELRGLNDGRRATRISVTSASGGFIVRLGDEPAVRVRTARGAVHCACGSGGCRHVASLRACGFVEGERDYPATPMAA